MSAPHPINQRIVTAADTIASARQRLIGGGGSEFERRLVLRDLLAAETEVRTTGHQVGNLLGLIVAAGDDDGGRAA